MTEQTGTLHNYANVYKKNWTVRKILPVGQLSDAKNFPDTNPFLHFGGWHGEYNRTDVPLHTFLTWCQVVLGLSSVCLYSRESNHNIYLIKTVWTLQLSQMWWLTRNLSISVVGSFTYTVKSTTQLRTKQCFMGLAQMKSISGLFWKTRHRPLQLGPVDIEAGTLSTHHTVSHHLHNELPVLLLEPLQTSRPWHRHPI
jgi:hypothetical protein